jgi:hypothetical protein
MEFEGFDSATTFRVEWQRETGAIRRGLATECVAQGLTRHSTGARVNLAFIEGLNDFDVECAPGQFGR